MPATVVAMHTQELAQSSKDCTGRGEMGVFSQACENSIESRNPSSYEKATGLWEISVYSCILLSRSAMAATGEWRDGLCCSDTFSRSCRPFIALISLHI